MKNISFYIIIALLLNSCSLTQAEEPTYEIRIERASVVEIKDFKIQGKKVFFSIVGAASDSCERFHSSETTFSNRAVQTTLYNRRVESSEIMCALVMIYYTVDVVIEIQAPGEYTFAFWNSAEE